MAQIMVDVKDSSSRMRPFLVAFLTALAVAGSTLLWFESQHYIGDGGFDVDVILLSNAARIESVAIEAYFHKEDADRAIEPLVLETKPKSYNGEPIKMDIRSVTRWNDLRLISRGWQKYLVIVASLEGNRRVGKIVEIPDMCREIRVELP